MFLLRMAKRKGVRPADPWRFTSHLKADKRVSIMPVLFLFAAKYKGEQPLKSGLSSSAFFSIRVFKKFYLFCIAA